MLVEILLHPRDANTKEKRRWISQILIKPPLHKKIHKNIRKTLNGELPGALQPTACKVGTA